jgi:molybdopterin molybdotransferase
MPPLSFLEARALVIDTVSRGRVLPGVEFIRLAEADGRVLAEGVNADRDYPPLDRSMRDGFAVRAAEVPGTLTVIGEVRAGERFQGDVQAGQAVEIMTGAPLPDGADAIVMVEHVRVEGNLVTLEKGVTPGHNVSPRGCDALAGGEVLRAGQVIGFPEVAVLATVGVSRAAVYRRPRVAILTTGDEILDIGARPLAHQIRDSNAWSLASQVRRAGGEPILLPMARDSVEETTEIIGEGLKANLLLVSGGVSAGKYDLVESVLAKYGAEFYFDRVRVQPGQPLVFGRAQGTFFFGLPGNPGSTMVCFEVFARAAVELLGGQENPRLPLTEAVLSEEFHHRPGLTRFLPAALSRDGSQVTPVPWSGSADVMALARANAFLVAEPDKPQYAAGERIRVLMR